MISYHLHYFYSEMIFISLLLFSLLQYSFSDEQSEKHEPIYVYSSAHQYQSDFPPKVPIKRNLSLTSRESSSSNNLTKRFRVDTTNRTQKIEFNGSLIRPITLLLLSYLTSNSHNTSRTDDLTFDNTNETESRNIASWLSVLAKKLKRNKEPLRRDQILTRPPIIPINYDRQIPINYLSESIPNNGPLIIPNFIPHPEGFPGPLNPESILLPPELIENSGIKYWLDFIEKANIQDGMNNVFDIATNTENDEVLLPKRIKKPRPYIDYQKKPDNKINKQLSTYDETVEADSDSEDDSDRNEVFKQSTMSPRCDKFTSHICIDDFEYPEQAIVDEIYKRRELFELMYSEVKGNVPLVDGIPRDIEESYNYDHYYTDSDEERSDLNDERSDPMASSNSEEYTVGGHTRTNKGTGGFICPSEILYGKPKLARNIKGDWKVIVNAAEFTQTVRMEKCLKPNEECNYVSDPAVETRCAQVHSFHRLMVFEKGKGFYIDTFRIPTACSCHANKRIDYSPMREISDDSRNTKSPLQLSNSLWPLLGGLSTNGNSDINAFNSNELIKNQLNLLQQLKKNQINPEVLLQQISNTEGVTGLNSISGQSLPIQTQNIGSNKIDYLLPGMIYAEEPVGFRPVQLPTGTSAITTGNGNAPLVQVIHVPVTSHPITPQLQHQPQLQQFPVYKHSNDFNGMSAFASTDSKTSTDSKFLNETKYDYFNDDFVFPKLSNSTISHNNTNMEPFTEVSDSWPNKSEQETPRLLKRKTFTNSKIDRKINFSYHPILDYINHPVDKR